MLIVFTIEFNLFLPSVLGSRHCTVLAHILKKVTQPAGLASPNSGTSTGQGSVTPLLPFSSLVVLFLWFHRTMKRDKKTIVVRLNKLLRGQPSVESIIHVIARVFQRAPEKSQK